MEQAPSPDNARRIAELIVSLMKPNFDVYLDIAVRNGEEPDWEYTEVPKTKDRLNMEDFRDGRE